MVLHSSVSFPAPQRARLRSLLRQLGTTKAPAVLGASLPALQRAAGGMPIRYGTALAIREALAQLPGEALAAADHSRGAL